MKFRQSLGNPIVKCKHKTAATEFCQCSLLFHPPLRHLSNLRPLLQHSSPNPRPASLPPTSRRARPRLRPTVLLLLKLAFEFGLFLCVIIYLICCCHLATFFRSLPFWVWLFASWASITGILRPFHPPWACLAPWFGTNKKKKSPFHSVPPAIVIDALLLLHIGAAALGWTNLVRFSLFFDFGGTRLCLLFGFMFWHFRNYFSHKMWF